MASIPDQSPDRGDPRSPDDLVPTRARPDASFALRAVLIVVGTTSLAVGLIGIVLPVLPSTVFFLIAAACYARASTRLYTWLLTRRVIGPVVTEWRRSRSLPPGVKTRAMIAVALTFAISILVVDSWPVRGLLLATGIILATFLARLPTRVA